MSKNFIERYCYLIVFATYLRERAIRYESRIFQTVSDIKFFCSDFDISFSLWMDIRAEIREIIANGSKNFNFM